MALNNNQLSGSIPTTIGLITQLTYEPSLESFDVAIAPPLTIVTDMLALSSVLKASLLSHTEQIACFERQPVEWYHSGKPCTKLHVRRTSLSASVPASATSGLEVGILYW